MKYAVIVGSFIAPIALLAVTELSKIFDWVEQHQNGIILFIDKADAFLINRKGSDMSEYLRHTINCFLYRTGSPSENVVIVMATNLPEKLDETVHNRTDKVNGFNVPTLKERQIILYHYFVKYCTTPSSTKEKATMILWKYPRSIFYW
jgi:ATPase family AAA domain-containing protein 3A/B